MDNIEIIELEEAPSLLKSIAIDEAKGISTIEHIMFGAYMNEPRKDTSAYYPETHTITIDMGSALNSMALYNKGMMFIPNVWYTLIYNLGHEIGHALQFEASPELIQYKSLPQELEDQANEYGKEMMTRWAQANPKIPDLKDMGWVGKQLVVMLNAIYSQAPDAVEEVDYIKIGAAAKLEDVLAIHDADDEALRERTTQDVDKGEIGIKVDGKRFLTAYEFMGFI